MDVDKYACGHCSHPFVVHTMDDELQFDLDMWTCSMCACKVFILGNEADVQAWAVEYRRRLHAYVQSRTEGDDDKS